LAGQLLGARLTLHDVADVEALAGRVLHERIREWRASHFFDPNTPRGRELRELALTYLIETAWELSRDHDPSVQAFSTRAYRTLRLRFVDWYRSTLGDSRHAPRPELLSLDTTAAAYSGGSDYHAETLGETIADDAANVEEEAFHSVAFGLEWADLSLAGFKALTEIGERLEAGKSLEAIARELGESRRSVNRRLGELQAEILAKRPDLPEWLAA
jgi:AraC-like DNA-binding protein